MLNKWIEAEIQNRKSVPSSGVFIELAACTSITTLWSVTFPTAANNESQCGAGCRCFAVKVCNFLFHRRSCSLLVPGLDCSGKPQLPETEHTLLIWNCAGVNLRHCNKTHIFFHACNACVKQECKSLARRLDLFALSKFGLYPKRTPFLASRFVPGW